MSRRTQIDSTKPRKSGLVNESRVLFGLVLVFFGAISSRLFWLQVVEGSLYRKLSEENRIRLVSRAPIRGRLLDRNGQLLTGNKLTYTLSIQLILNSFDLRYDFPNHNSNVDYLLLDKVSFRLQLTRLPTFQMFLRH